MELRTLLNIYHTHSSLQSASHTVLKPFKISVQQFNILRILRGQKGEPISVSDITDRMLDKMSNTSRLIEKLRSKGLLERRECPQDRRRAEVLPTEEGLRIVNEASREMEAKIEQRLKVLSPEDLTVLNQILDKLNTNN
ncbi:MAG: MarR family transcriptional regulator [Saprospiraceae bacterium]|nr:MarR family transcriptional regulator [Saprospiraceae bacterium]